MCPLIWSRLEESSWAIDKGGSFDLIHFLSGASHAIVSRSPILQFLQTKGTLPAGLAVEMERMLDDPKRTWMETLTDPIKAHAKRRIE